MSRFVGFLVALLIAGTALASDYEIRMYRIAMPVAEDVRAAIDKHLNQPLDSLLQDQIPLQEGSQILAVTPPSDWDGSDLLAYPGVEGGGNPIPIGNRRSLFVGRETPVEYLDPRNNGRFDRKIGYEQHGLNIALSRSGIDQVRVWVTLTRPGPRQPLDGVSLDVGPPTQDEGPVWTNFITRTALGQWAAALFTVRESKDSHPELLLVFIRDLGGSAESTPVPVDADLDTPIEFSVELKYLGLTGATAFEDTLIPDDGAVPIAGEGLRIVAIKLPDSDSPVPVNGHVTSIVDALYAVKGVELLSAPRITTVAGLTDRDDTSQTLFKVVLPNNPRRVGTGGGSFGGGVPRNLLSDDSEPLPKTPQVSWFTDLVSDRRTIIGQFMASKSPGKPGVIADIMTQRLKVANETGDGLGEEKEIYTGIVAGVRIACDSAVENVVLDVAPTLRYLDWPPPIRLSRKGSSARPNPIETTVADESTPPRYVERGGWFRQLVEDGETLAYLLRDDVRDDLTLVFVTIDHVERDTFVPLR